MTDQLKLLLCEYLGQLMYYEDREKDWILNSKIIRKINAIHVLLDMSEKETTMQRIKKMIKSDTSKF